MSGWSGAGYAAGQRQLTLDDDQLLALAKLLGSMTERNMLAFSDGSEYQAYIGAVALVNAAAEDVINESRSTRR